MNKPDKSNDKPNGRPKGSYDDDSLTTRLVNLAEGACESKSVRLPPDEATPDEIRKASERLSGAMRKAVARAGTRTKSVFTTETGSFTTNSRIVVVTCVATCLKLKR